MRLVFVSRFRQTALAGFALLVALVSAAPAWAVPITVSSQNIATCDALSVPPEVDELGTAFPQDELISSTVQPETVFAPCPATDLALVNQVVDITNLTTKSFSEVWYVADPETTITNIDGLVNGADAFRIDRNGKNQPLVGESLTVNGIFEPNETWTFVLQDYSNTQLVSPASLGSIGVPSPISTISSGSIIAVPEPTTIALLTLGLAGISAAGRRRG